MSYDKLKVLKKYIDHMYEKVGELYQLNIDVDEMLREILSNIVSIKPLYAFSRYMYSLNKLNSIINDLTDVVRDFERYIITKKSYVYEEDFVIRGAIVWHKTLINLATFRPFQQIVIARTLDTPENIMLKLMLLYVKAKIIEFYEKLCEAFKDIENRLAKEFGSEVDIVGLLKINPSYIKEKFLKKLILQIDKMLRNTILFHIRTPEKALELIDFSVLDLKRLISIITRIEETLSNLANIIQIDSAKKWKPGWIFKLIQFYKSVREYLKDLDNNLDDVVAAVEHVKTLSGEEFCNQVKEYIRFISWKLYELYIVYLVIKVISRLLKVHAIGFEDRKIVIEYNDKKKLITIYWGKPLERSILSSIQTLDGVTMDQSIVEKLRGRPDLAMDIQGRVSIVLEAKFTRSIEYLTQSRFKVMAYMYEYKADIGILAYPGTPRKPGLIDEEGYETLEVLRSAEKNDGFIIHLNNKSKLYVIPVIPLNSSLNSNIDKLEKPIKDALSLLLTKTSYTPNFNE